MKHTSALALATLLFASLTSAADKPAGAWRDLLDDKLSNFDIWLSYRGDQITIRKAKPKKGKMSRGDRIVARALAHPGTENLELTTDQIMEITRGWSEDDPGR